MELFDRRLQALGDSYSLERELGSGGSGATISIDYGRPYLKGRPESQMMPIGQPWRTGADQATVLTTDAPLTFGNVKLAPGSYTINTEPGEKEWHLLLGKLGSPNQWGIRSRRLLNL